MGRPGDEAKGLEDWNSLKGFVLFCYKDPMCLVLNV